MLSGIKEKGRGNRVSYRNLVRIIILALILVSVFSVPATAQARTIRTRVTVRVELVVWRGPSFGTRILAVLFKGRRFTVDGRNFSGTWLHGITDRGTRGWIPSSGFLRLHPEVNPMLLPVLTRFVTRPATMQMVMPQPTPVMRTGY